MNRKKVQANFGSAVHLECPLGNKDQKVQWYHYNLDGRRRHVQAKEGKFVLTQEQGLVLIGLGEAEAGQYDCRVNHETIASYRVHVDYQRCTTQKSLEITIKLTLNGVMSSKNTEMPYNRGRNRNSNLVHHHLPQFNPHHFNLTHFSKLTQMCST